MDISEWKCLPQTLGDIETVDTFKYSFKGPNSPPLWHWPYQCLKEFVLSLVKTNQPYIKCEYDRLSVYNNIDESTHTKNGLDRVVNGQVS